jgi:spore maturation protein CgeB
VKIVWVGPIYSASSVLGMCKVNALRELGHYVMIFDDRRYYQFPFRVLPRVVATKIVDRLPGLLQRDHRAMNQALLRLIQHTRPELVIVDKGLSISVQTLQAIGALGAMTVNWFPDDLQRLDWIKRLAPYYTYFVSFDPYTIAVLREAGFDNVRYLPFGCDPAVHRTMTLTPDEPRRYACEVCFIGAWYPEREAALSALTEFDLKIWGYKDWAQTDLAPFYQGYIGNGEPMVKVYNACQIAVNIHYHSVAHGVNYRTFEIPGCGAFQIVDDRPDVDRLFTIGQEVVTYRFGDVAELREKVRYYLEHPEARAVIARQGQERAHRDHTLRRRMEDLLQIVQADGSVEGGLCAEAI